jgi:hypothetical protein
MSVALHSPNFKYFNFTIETELVLSLKHLFLEKALKMILQQKEKEKLKTN